MAMSALFYALKRATGAPANAYVPVIRGPAFRMDDDMGHAWNWIVDAERGTINALDATGSGDVELEQYRNVSAFLASTCDLVSNGFDLATFLCATIDPETDAGQLRLFHFAEHFSFPPELRARIAVHLEATGFERLVPDWRDRLAHVDASLGRVERFAFSQAADALPALEPLRLRCRPISNTPNGV